MDCIVRYGEIGIKGGNRHIFEKRLVCNIRNFLKKNSIPFDEIKRLRGRIVIKSTKKNDLIKNVFGIVSYSWAEEINPEIESIKEAIKDYCITMPFRVSCQRLDKRFLLTSLEVEKEIGAFVAGRTEAKVDLKNFRQEIGIEIVDNRAFVFDNRNDGFGGLPVGIEGAVECRLKDKDDLLAALLVMKRGCRVIANQKSPNIQILERYHWGRRIEEEGTAHAFIAGDRINSIKEHDTNLTVFRPLVGFTDEMIKKKKERFNLQ